MPTLRLLRLLRRYVAPTLRPSGSTIAGRRLPGPTRRAPGARPSRRRRRGGPASGSRTGSACICSAASTRTPSSGLPCCCASGVGDVAEPHRVTLGGRAPPSGPCEGPCVDSRRCEESSASAATSRTGASNARRSRAPSGAAAARGPGRSRRTTRTRRRWASRRVAPASVRHRTGSGSTRSGSRPPTLPTSTRRTRPRSTPRSDSTPTRARSTSVARPAPASARCAWPSRAVERPSWSRRTGGPGSPRARRSRPAATPRPRCWSATAAGAPVLAEHLGSGIATEEFIDRWRTPGEPRSKVWEERFGETKYVPLGEQAWNAALKSAALAPDQVDRVVLTGLHARAVAGARQAARGQGRRAGRRPGRDRRQRRYRASRAAPHEHARAGRAG